MNILTKWLRSTAAWRGARLTAGHWSTRLRGSGLRVLLYHHFPESSRASLEAQCAFLRGHYTPIALSEAITYLERHADLPKNAVAVTIDDGYADFAQVAYPCFSRYDIPSTIFVTEQLIDGGWLWFDRVAYAIENTTCNILSLCVGPWGGPVQFALGTAAERSVAASTLTRQAKRLPHAAVERFVTAIENATAIERPRHPSGVFAGMRWDELQQLSENGDITIGAHTTTHPILARIEDADELRTEISDNRRRLSQRLGTPVDFFAYPNGQPADIDARVVAAIQEAGYRAACTTTPGVNRVSADLLRIKRLSVRAETPPSALAEMLAAAR